MGRPSRPMPIHLVTFVAPISSSFPLGPSVRYQRWVQRTGRGVPPSRGGRHHLGVTFCPDPLGAPKAAIRTDDAPRVRCSATLGEEPDAEVALGWPLRVDGLPVRSCPTGGHWALSATGGGISMPDFDATSTVLFSLPGRSPNAGGSPGSSSAGLPAFSKKSSYKSPGVWVVSILPGTSPTFLWACSAPLGT